MSNIVFGGAAMSPESGAGEQFWNKDRFLRDRLYEYNLKHTTVLPEVTAEIEPIEVVQLLPV